MGRGPSKHFYAELNERFVEGTLTCLKPAVFKSRIKIDFPLVLNIEPTNDCNSKFHYMLI